MVSSVLPERKSIPPSRLVERSWESSEGVPMRMVGLCVGEDNSEGGGVDSADC